MVEGKLVVDDLHKVAVFLNPAMKDLLMYGALDQKNIIKTVRQMYEPTACSPVGISTTKVSGVSEFSKFCRYSDTNSAGLTDEIALYQSFPPPPMSQSVLDFWKEHSVNLPNLGRLALKIFAIQASSTSAERLFSDAGNIFTDKRTLLRSDKLDDLLYLKWNLSRDVPKPKEKKKRTPSINVD